MKHYKNFIAIAVLFLANSVALGVVPYGVSPQSNYGRFLIGFSRPVITSNNVVERAWVEGAVQALSQDNMLGNLMDNNVLNKTATTLWYALDPQINYYAGLPQNRNNPAFRTRIWESLNRTLDEVRRSGRFASAPMQPQAKMQPQTNLIREGLTALKTLEDRTSKIIITDPTYFYAAGSVQVAWLREALAMILVHGKLPLTQQNFASIEGELVRVVDQLMRQILSRDPRRLSYQQQNAILQMVRYQVEQFMRSQPISR